MNDTRIICSAIWYKDLPNGTHLPINIEKGIVVCGHRHYNCISIMKDIGNLRTVKNAENGVGESVQGFLTNTNYFVDRKEAYKIAYDANQIIGPNKGCPENSIGLTSEDLY